MASAEVISSATSAETSGTESQMSRDRELASLRENFQGQCRVSDDKKTVKLQPENLDIVFIFKLPDSYPSSVPVIEIRSESLAEDDIFDLISFMTMAAESMSPVSIEELVLDAIGWLKEGGFDLRGGRKKSKKTESAEANTKWTKKQKKTKIKHVDKEEKKKKVPMRTAMDVVERIQWDPQLPQDEFIVGYLDRMKGLQEKYFTAFSWEDIASVDYTVLAIPKHRIQYFKYKHEIVWDKRCRLDNVFGSTGSGKTIRDIIAKIDGKATSNGVNASDDEPHIDNEGEGHVDSDYYEEDSTDSDSDSDDDINVVIGNDCAGAYGGSFSEDDDVKEASDDDEAGFDKYWRDKLRPNYFLALRITDETVRNNVREIQTNIASHDARLKECAIPCAALHVTLCTVGLETPEQVQNAVECLNEAKEELISFIPKTKKLKFKGVDNFFNRVVYGKAVDCPQEFYSLVDHLKLCLNEKGIAIRDYHEFVPHMTLMKISRPFGKATGKKYVPPWLYSCFGEMDIGEQSIDNLHLCEMGDSRQNDGFYMTATSIDL